MDVKQIKQRFGIIGNSSSLSRAIDIAVQVAPTDLSVLITGESGTGKEVFPQIIHQFSSRKHYPYIAVNCGAIPEGTIDSELFGHQKGAFTGAVSDRKGYFESADKGTIFLDEIGELPLSTQVRLLRVLETGEFMKVGSSKIIKTDVRLVAATNVNLPDSVKKSKFREDLYYRLNTVPINMEPLRKRNDDIYLLFRKFSQDFADKYRMPPIKLTPLAQKLLNSYNWPGNIRQLKNITEQISVIEQTRELDEKVLFTYLPIDNDKMLPALYNNDKSNDSFSSEREILYKVLFDMKKDMTELKKLVFDLMKGDVPSKDFSKKESLLPSEIYDKLDLRIESNSKKDIMRNKEEILDTEEFVEESLLLVDKEIEFIKKALAKHNGKRKNAAKELGISERTLYRKIKEYDIV